ncbi:PstS family phosphate ABC transporter substrate-binding protein [Halorarum salinum]|uniref:PstS family phosphate ABC transporter substrate-binding protein n=1 Tax=Halorarum salinum TaxID=2743089 RepID=A0A7D5L9L4_9EURY|nr:PstS family phosphate ABC transporter substrate-binding protein [Halobaculum salinum]QLG61546.1 PstS family phosphate ABC transporter substrate-binding protein [Halobaculum salinum]
MADNQGLSGLSRRKFLAVTGAAGVAGIAGCTSEENPGGSDGSGGSNGGSGGQNLSGEISIAGSSTVFPIASAVAEEFQKEHSDVNVSVQSTGSGGGFANFFCDGKTDFNNASRPIKEEEKQQCEGNDVSWQEINVATDALTVVVNNEADFVDSMTVDELARIWGPDAGNDQTWSDVRSEWPDETIERFGAAETSGTFDYFTETIVGESGAHTQDYQATEDDNTIVQGVAGSEFAIGYFGFAYYQGNKEKVKGVAIDDGDGPVEPTLENAKAGKYTPLSRPLFTYASQESMQEEHKAEFARYFVEQSANQELISDQIGYVPNTQEDMQKELDELNSFIDNA